jgi:hypothetical protein
LSPPNTVQSPVAARFLEEPEDVEGFILAFDSLKQQALDPGESAELVRGLAEAG